MFNPGWFVHSRSDGFAVLEIVTTDLQAPSRFVPLQKTAVQGQLVGPLAALRLVQVFRYNREQCDQVLEAAYYFPLPATRP